ncbi:MAG: (2Fe-2S)-binding protein [Deltaproteobacteria bacterium]|nr:(2Fe-2S)-binding protein [Deltaproteobacteria bacterium]
MDEITLQVNGEDRVVVAELWEPLLETLRDRLHLIGAKRGCDDGGCGACTVLVDGAARYSCMTPLARCRGKEILTIEGLAANGHLHPLQENFSRYDAAQCGYCTSGMILMSKALLDKIPHPGESDIRWYLVGNLCRCTGYRKIVQAVLETGKGSK